jgi:DsbC/DsbD-like thiol-disulfide interchange protein
MMRSVPILLMLAAVGGAMSAAHALEVMSVSPATTVQVKPSAWTRAALPLRVKPGYHVQANPVLNPSLIPIILKLEPTEDVSIGEPEYPIAKHLRLPGDGHDLVTYDGAFSITFPLRVRRTKDNAAGFALKGSLRYQACDDRHCLFPVTLPIVIGVRFEE